jgi:hypothetical protein
LLAEVVLDAKHVSTDAFATMGKTVTVAEQPALLQHDVVVAIGAVNFDLQRFLAGPFEAFRLSLVTMSFRDQAVQVRLQHGARRAS